MKHVALVDASALIAVADRAARQHMAVVSALQQTRRFIVPALVIAEAAHIIGGRLGYAAERQLALSLTSMDVIAPEPDDWRRIVTLLETYRSLRLGVVDASVVALAERLNVDVIVTLDQRHFRVVRPFHKKSFTLLPE